ncbi:hypothetical protein OBBRIDRAFT_885018 [Obba rivulosa]|uniref:Uncharacterized protein n=1 Tax=Obba rivulosa TaxID=1052685 RepID=A0A8E2J3U0_9APHY|nr:hypothetical protein OBBRIDRAFT_885018 [Obba rivulosa]
MAIAAGSRHTLYAFIADNHLSPMNQQHADSFPASPPFEQQIGESKTAPPDSPRKQTAPLTHLLILSSILAPIALLPYLATRTRLNALQRTVAETGRASTGLRHDLSHLIAAFTARRTEHERLVSLLNEMNTNMSWLRRRAEQAAADRAASEGRVLKELRAMKMELEKLEAAAVHSEQARAQTDRAERDKLQKLAAENDKVKSRLSRLDDLGSSLADVAAFMHEMELQQGMLPRKDDGRGIERIRQLAYKLQKDGSSCDRNDSKDDTHTSDPRTDAARSTTEERSF